MFNKQSIAFKFFVIILSSSALIFVVIFSYNYRISRKILVDLIENDAVQIANTTAARIENEMNAVERIPSIVALTIGGSQRELKDPKRFLETLVASDEYLFGAAIAYEPGKDKPYCPYVYRTDYGMEWKDLAKEGYDYLNWDWYKKPKELQGPVWSEPYFDEGGGNIYMSTFSVPFFSGEGRERKFAGVVTADVPAKWIDTLENSLGIAKGGYGFIIMEDGRVIVPNQHKLKLKLSDVFLQNLALEAAKNRQDMLRFADPLNKRRYWLALAPFSTHNGSIGVVFPEDELMADNEKLHRIIQVIGSVGILMLSIVIAFISISITRPLRMLAERTMKVSQGDFDFELPAKTSRDEIGSLVRSFASMRDALKKYIKELVRTSAENERIASELKTGSDIQMSMVPKVSQMFRDRKDFDCYATLVPAREVGGDLYDVFAIDDDRIFIAMGDVAGKGVPAALFMMRVMTALKTLSRVESEPARILELLNEQLISGNDSCMFVGLLCVVVDMKSGKATMANGGHIPPVLINRCNQVSFIDIGPGRVLGVFENEKFRTTEFRFEKGDMFLMYTDGVTEAFNSEGVAFGEDRLKATISALCEGSPKKLVEGVIAEIHKFSSNVAASDDMTMFCFEYRPEKKADVTADEKYGEAFVSLAPHLGELVVIETFTSAFARRYGLSDIDAYDVRLALTELFTNSVMYNVADTTVHKVKILMRLVDHSLDIIFEDDGVEFDPTKAPSPNLEIPVKEKDIGGLGIHLVKSVMSSIKYERIEGKNRVTLTKLINISPPL